ncbi:hypothetical protein BFG52_11530 [Acinetobacter larvae]|uniref:Transposase Helix-turn-helix domain-containing protein n=1 Tax=Acinetobacter larvae TaxID=1789224 RepID=A0A1B2M445_9GAMM|nr:hypothetical protein BFG52_11530 [Acinetobacter larvae]
MKYENFKNLNDDEFDAAVGISRELFLLMVKTLDQAESRKKKSGRPHSLCLEDQVLLTLNYFKNNKTQSQLSYEYHLAESNVNRTISKVETALSQSGQFSISSRHQVTLNNGDSLTQILKTKLSLYLHPTATD